MPVHALKILGVRHVQNKSYEKFEHLKGCKSTSKGKDKKPF